MYPSGYLQEGSLVLALLLSLARATRWLFCRLVARQGRTIVELPEETIADLTKRLRRAEGQVRGVQQMLAEGRDCRDIVTQLSAATKALEQAGFLLVAAGLTWCVSDPERAAAEGYALADVQKMFMKLA